MDNFLDSLKFIAFLILIGSGLVWAFISEVKRWSDISRKETEWKEAMQAARLTKIREPYKTIDRSRNPLFAPYFGKLDVFQQGHKTGFHTRPAVFNAYVGQMQGWNVLMSVLTYNTDVKHKHSRFQRICLLVGDMRLWPYFRIFPHGGGWWKNTGECNRWPFKPATPPLRSFRPMRSRRCSIVWPPAPPFRSCSARNCSILSWHCHSTSMSRRKTLGLRSGLRPRPPGPRFCTPRSPWETCFARDLSWQL